IVFGLEGFGNEATPEAFTNGDKEIFIDSFTGTGPGGPPDGDFDFVIGLTDNGATNVFTPIIINLHTGDATAFFFTNGLNSSVADTNVFNNSVVTMPVRAVDIGLIGASGTGQTQFNYQVATFNREA